MVVAHGEVQPAAFRKVAGTGEVLDDEFGLPPRGLSECLDRGVLAGHRQ
jgi:hypothetical protein